MNKENLRFIIQIIVIIIFIIISLALIGFIIYTFVRYANTPINELPTWIWWLLH